MAQRLLKQVGVEAAAHADASPKAFLQGRRLLVVAEQGITRTSRRRSVPHKYGNAGGTCKFESCAYVWLKCFNLFICLSCVQVLESVLYIRLFTYILYDIFVYTHACIHPFLAYPCLVILCAGWFKCYISCILVYVVAIGVFKICRYVCCAHIGTRWPRTS
jgi:hypothetical protein